MKPRKLLIKHSTKTFQVDQGDIFSSITFFRYFDIKDGAINLNKANFPNVLVLSQTCDLCRESEKSGSILSVLVVPLFPVEDYKSGIHLEALGIVEKPKDKGAIDKYRKKEHYRFRVLDFTDDEKIKYKLEDSFVIDFRYFFTADINQFSKKKYKVSLNELFREEISTAFSSYLSRIGLPDIKK